MSTSLSRNSRPAINDTRITTKRLAHKNNNISNPTLFVYKSADANLSTNHGEITFTKHDRILMTPPRYLNDTIISFFMQHHLDTQIQTEFKKNIYLFNSFFFAKLKSVRAKNHSNPEDSHVTFNNVSRWIKGDKIFTKDFLIMPVCERDHWILVIICYPSRNPSSTVDDIQDENLYEPAVIVLNSSTGHTPPIKKVLAQFLTYQWKLEEPTIRNFRINNAKCAGIKLIFPQLPQQKNNYNCGVFMLNYFFCFMKNPRKAYIKMFRGRDMKNWFEQNNINIGGERRRMQALVEAQIKAWKQKESDDETVSSTSKWSDRDEILQDFHIPLTNSSQESDNNVTTVESMDLSEDKNDDSIIVIN